MQLQGMLWILVSVIGFALLPILVAKAYSHGLDTSSATFGRFLGAFLLFEIHYLFEKKRTVPPLDDQVKIWGLGLLYSLSVASYFVALNYLTPLVFSFIYYTYPFFTVLLVTLIYKEKLHAYFLPVMVFNLSGIVLLSSGGPIKAELIGIIFTLFAAFFLALFFVFRRTLPENRCGLYYSKIMVRVMLVVFTCWWLIEGMPNLELSYLVGWKWVAVSSLLSTYVAFTGLVYGIHLLGGSYASLLSCQEPLWTVLFSFLILHITLTGQQWLGAVLVISVVGYLSWKQLKPL